MPVHMYMLVIEETLFLCLYPRSVIIVRSSSKSADTTGHGSQLRTLTSSFLPLKMELVKQKTKIEILLVSFLVVYVVVVVLVDSFLDVDT